MIKVKTKYELQKLDPQSGFVLVTRVNKIFHNVNGEWIEKAYFTINECAEAINGMTSWKVHQFIDRLGLKTPTARRSKCIKININQLKVLINAYNMRSEGVSFDDIKERLL
jgi:hypothetical protein